MSFVASTSPTSAYKDFYGGLQPGDVPLYSIAAAAGHLRLPSSTVLWWARGGPQHGHTPVITGESTDLLSFNDLVELYVVKALTRGRNVPLKAVRRAVEYVASEMDADRVLLSQELFTFGHKLLIRHLGAIVDIGRSGQLALEQVVESYMERIERSEVGLPIKLYPDFSAETKVDHRYPVSVSPLVAFGRPTLTGTGITTTVVAARVDSGETPAEMAEDYGVAETLVMNALVFENAA